MGNKVKSFMADFETTTDPENCYVWAYAICEVSDYVKTENNVVIGTSIDDFMMWCEKEANHKVYFHNLKFDGEFIINWLLRNGFEYVEDPKDRKSKTFTALISDKGLWYSIEVFFKVNKRNVNKITFQDSLKLIPLSVDEIAKSFDLPIQKLHLNYDCHNGMPPGTPLTDHEKNYIQNDVRIVAHAIDYFYSQGLTKMTIGSCALDEYKKLVSKNAFNRYYPTPKYDEDVRQSYRGGFTYLNPKYSGKTIKKGLVLDVNSLYPSVMYYDYLPYGTPIFFNGQYEEDDIYPLFVQMFRCKFRIKKNKIPTIQIKHSGFFKSNEYLTSSGDDEVVLCLTSVDLKLFLDHYDVFNLEYMSGWKFKATKGLFKEYIDKWSSAKIKAKKEGNHGLYLIAKLFLNSLYGKFGSSTKIKEKIPYIDPVDNIVHYKDTEVKEKDGIYIAIASFITSYARLKTISSAQKVQDAYYSGLSKAEFVYADTDSLHINLNGEDIEEFLNGSGLEIDSTKLGAWDHEMTFSKGKYLRQKCYIENEIITEEDYLKGVAKDEEGNYKKEDYFLYNKDKEGFYKLKITVAGMPKGCYDQVNFRKFKIGATFEGKKQPKKVKGGVVLSSVDFTIKK